MIRSHFPPEGVATPERVSDSRRNQGVSKPTGRSRRTVLSVRQSTVPEGATFQRCLMLPSEEDRRATIVGVPEGALPPILLVTSPRGPKTPDDDPKITVFCAHATDHRASEEAPAFQARPSIHIIYSNEICRPHPKEWQRNPGASSLIPPNNPNRS